MKDNQRPDGHYYVVQVISNHPNSMINLSCLKIAPDWSLSDEIGMLEKKIPYSAELIAELNIHRAKLEPYERLIMTLSNHNRPIFEGCKIKPNGRSNKAIIDTIEYIYFERQNQTLMRVHISLLSKL